MRPPRPKRNLALPYRAVFYRKGSPLEVKDFEGQHQFASIADVKHYAQTHWSGLWSREGWRLAPTHIEVFVVEGPLWHQMSLYRFYAKTGNGWRKVSLEEGDRLLQIETRRELDRRERVRREAS